MKRLASALLVCLLAPGAHAQGPVVAFEVASIKPSAPGGPRGGFGMAPNGRFMAHGATLAELITLGYSTGLPLRRFQVTGGLAWLDTDRFDIEATSSLATPTPAQSMRMIRALLVERFKLVAREETTDAPIYVLNLARSDGQLGPKMKRSANTCFAPSAPPPSPEDAAKCVYNIGYGVLTARGVPMQTLAYSIQNFYGIGRLVVDHTGLPGGYDMDMEWAPMTQFRQPGNLDPPADAAERPVNSGPTIFVALREQLGLSLDAARGPMPTVVIERVEKPTPD